MNNHYIPQFLLKHFCENGTIQYCDIENRKVEARNTRSVFSEKGITQTNWNMTCVIKLNRSFLSF